MFRANDTQQITVYDSFLNQPAHIQRLIEKPWAKDFSDVIFPAIHEGRAADVHLLRCTLPVRPSPDPRGEASGQRPELEPVPGTTAAVREGGRN